MQAMHPVAQLLTRYLETRSARFAPRAQTLLTSPVFARLREAGPSLISQLVAVQGDISQPDFGIQVRPPRQSTHPVCMALPAP